MARDPSDPRRRQAPPLRVPEGVQWGSSQEPTTPAPAPARVSLAPVPARVAASLPPEPIPRDLARPATATRQGPAAVQLRPSRRAPPPEPAALPPAEARPTAFVPRQPRSWVEAGVDVGGIRDLVLRFLLAHSRVSSKRIADGTALALTMVREITDGLKDAKLVTYVGTNVVGDFICELTAAGREKAVATRRHSTYVGPAPVLWADYLESVTAQSLSGHDPGPADLQRAFADLSVSEDLLDRLGPAITSCQPMFLHGEPGNGKTSLAERITACYGDAIWIPRMLAIGGNLVQLFDPAIHEEVPLPAEEATARRVDPRWVRIRRPTVVAGGELTLDMLEFAHDRTTHVVESPLHLKANCGLLVIDDFGRGKTPPTDLLNRWIFPLERKVDFLSLPDGRKLAVPFECMLVFSTNLQPRDLADEAFLRRIPYKVHVGDPDEYEFADLVTSLAEKMHVRLPERSVKYLVERHYKLPERPMRWCHPRDLLQQVVHLAAYRSEEAVAGPAQWDAVVRNYFGLV